jgi:hypothetical protein
MHVFLEAPKRPEVVTWQHQGSALEATVNRPV